MEVRRERETEKCRTSKNKGERNVEYAGREELEPKVSQHMGVCGDGEDTEERKSAWAH